MPIDWVATTISIAALAVAIVTLVVTLWQIREQRKQFEEQLGEQKIEFERQLKEQAEQVDAQLRKEDEKINMLAGAVDALQRGTKAQEELAKLTEQQNQLLAASAQVQREQLHRDKRSLGSKIWHGIFGG